MLPVMLGGCAPEEQRQEEDSLTTEEWLEKIQREQRVRLRESQPILDREVNLVIQHGPRIKYQKGDIRVGTDRIISPRLAVDWLKRERGIDFTRPEVFNVAVRRIGEKPSVISRSPMLHSVLHKGEVWFGLFYVGARFVVTTEYLIKEAPTLVVLREAIWHEIAETYLLNYITYEMNDPFKYLDDRGDLKSLPEENNEVHTYLHSLREDPDWYDNFFGPKWGDSQ